MVSCKFHFKFFTQETLIAFRVGFKVEILQHSLACTLVVPFPWHTLVTDMFYWKRMDFLIVADVFSKYFIVRKLPNSTSAAICAELSMIVTELGLPHIIRSDNGPCYNSKEFKQFLQCYNITHQTSSPNHPRSHGFVERMVRVAKKLMDKAGKEGKPWISGLFDYRVTPQ